jgi:MFS family permease
MFKQITKTVWLIGLVSLLNDFSSEMLYPVIPLYLEQIGYGSLLIGVLEGVAECLGGLTKIYTGSLSDAMKRRLPFVQLGYALSVLSRPLMGLFQHAFPIVGARILDRAGKGIRTGARDALLGDESTDSNRAEVFGFHRSMDTFGAVLGPLAALAFLYYFPEQYRTVFLLTIIPGVIAIFFTFGIEEKKHKVTKEKLSLKHHFAYFTKASISYKYFVAILLIFAFASSSDMYLLLRAKESGLTDVQVLMAYVLFNLVFALTAFPIGKLADKKLGSFKMLIVGLLIYAACYYVIGFYSSAFMISVGFILYGLYYACTDGIIKTILLKLSPKDEKASAVGYYAGVNSILLLFANIFAGAIWFTYNGSKMLFVYTIIICLITVILLIVFRKRFS